MKKSVIGNEIKQENIIIHGIGIKMKKKLFNYIKT